MTNASGSKGANDRAMGSVGGKVMGTSSLGSMPSTADFPKSGAFQPQKTTPTSHGLESPSQMPPYMPGPKIGR
jgi:hypothetical protein